MPTYSSFLCFTSFFSLLFLFAYILVNRTKQEAEDGEGGIIEACSSVGNTDSDAALSIFQSLSHNTQ